MTPSKRIDRIFAGVGRVAISSGTDHAPTFRRINAMLTGLYKIGRLDVLKGIRDGAWTPLVVLNFYERGQLDRLPTAETAASLATAFRTFATTYEASASYRADLMTSVRHVERVATKGHAVADAAKVLRALKETMRGTPVAFNRLRTHLLAFASETQGKYTTLWNDLARVNRFKKAEGTRVRSKLRRPLTVAELDLVCAAFVDWPVYGGRKGSQNRRGEKTIKRVIRAADLANMAQVLATTGMRPQEYWQRDGASWSVGAGHVAVRGTKTAAAVRPTFWLAGLIVIEPKCGEQFFRARFTEATEQALRVGLDLYSLRRTFAKLCESARLDASRKDAYMGHGPKTVGDLYLQTSVLPFVRDDGALVEAFITAERARAAARPNLKLETGE
jgi:integrase